MEFLVRFYIHDIIQNQSIKAKHIFLLLSFVCHVKLTSKFRPTRHILLYVDLCVKRAGRRNTEASLRIDRQGCAIHIVLYDLLCYLLNALVIGSASRRWQKHVKMSRRKKERKDLKNKNRGKMAHILKQRKRKETKRNNLLEMTTLSSFIQREI